MKKLPVFLLTLSVILAVAGCKSKSTSDAAPQPVASSDTGSATSPWKIEMRMTPERPSMIKPITFTVHIVDGTGNAVDNAQVRGALTMKTMDMGKNELQLSPKGNGDYEGTAKELDMSGPWDFVVDASLNGFHAQKTFEIVVYD